MQLSCIKKTDQKVTYLPTHLVRMPAPIVQIIMWLRDKGVRVTPARQSLLEIFAKHESPMTALEIQAALKKRGLLVNKTTIYRELHFLLRHDLAQVLQFGDRQKRYELIYRGSQHHHHVVCKKCGRVEEIGLIAVEKLLVPLEKRLARKVDFSEVGHTLEFFGLCNICTKK